MYMLIPNVDEVEKSLGEFADIMEVHNYFNYGKKSSNLIFLLISRNLFFQANEVLLFEKSTFLIIAHAQRADHRDVHRFEKISNIIKQFKLSCIKLAAQFTVSFFFRI